MNALLVDRRDRLVILTINRPDAYNALNAEVLASLRQAVDSAASDPEVRAVVMTGRGEKAFCAGADLKEIARMGADRAHQMMQAGQEVVRLIERTPLPVIAAVNGLALGGGFELILASTFPILSQTASLGLPESSLGLIPGYGGTQRLPRAVPAPVAAHLMLTGRRLDAQRAYYLGLTPLPPVEPDEVLNTAISVADQIAAQGPLAVRSILKALEVGRDAPLDAGLGVETGLAALAIAGEESTEGVGAFLERRSAVFPDPEAS